MEYINILVTARFDLVIAPIDDKRRVLSIPFRFEGYHVFFRQVCDLRENRCTIRSTNSERQRNRPVRRLTMNLVHEHHGYRTVFTWSVCYLVVVTRTARIRLAKSVADESEPNRFRVDDHENPSRNEWKKSSVGTKTTPYYHQYISSSSSSSLSLFFVMRYSWCDVS